MALQWRSSDTTEPHYQDLEIPKRNGGRLSTIYIASLWGEMRSDVVDGPGCTGRWDLKLLFKDWLHPTEPERVLFELELTHPYPPQEILDAVMYRTAEAYKIDMEEM